MFPPNGVTLEHSANPGPLGLRVTGGGTPLTILVNGIAVAVSVQRGRNLSWERDGPGFVRLSVMNARGAADTVMVRVQ